MLYRCFLLLALMWSVASATARETYIVRLREGVQPQAAMRAYIRPVLAFQGKQQDAAQRAAMADIAQFAVVELPDDSSLTPAMLAEQPWVAELYPNRRITLHAAAAMPVQDVDVSYALKIVGASNAWRIATGKGVVVGIIDTGITWWHPSLRPLHWVNPGEDANGNGSYEPWASEKTNGDGVFGDFDGIDSDGNGFIDDVIGYDFVDQTFRNVGDDAERDEAPDDEQGHGTSVAGVIASIDTASMTPLGLANEARLMTLRAFDMTGNAEEDDIAAALLYAALNGADVVNMSFGDGVDSPLLRAAVKAAADMGCVLVASAGNSGTTSRQYPASYDDVIAVAATNDRDVRASFSSTGSSIGISAPGQAIPTTRAGGGYRTVSGTSFAAPYVAAAAALLRQIHPAWTASEIISTLREYSTDLGEKGWDPLYGDGRLQADAALQAVAPATIKITSPGNEQELDLRRVDSVRVVGSALCTTFKRYDVLLGRGVEPTSWVVVGSGDQRRDTTLAVIPADSLVPGPHVIALRVTTVTGRTLEDRVRITVVDTAISFTATEVINAWKDSRRAVVVTTTTSRPTVLTAHFLKGTDTVRTVVDQQRRTKTHSITIEGLPTRVALKLVLEGVSATGDTARTTTSFTLAEETAPQGPFNGFTSDVVPFTGYVLNDVRDLYGDSTRTVLCTELDGVTGEFGSLWTHVDTSKTSQMLFRLKRHRTATTWIPRGVGDANGDGITDILCHVVGRTALFQAAAPGGSPFERMLFSDTVSGNLQAAAMADLTGDGREELLCLTDSGLVVISYRNNAFVQVGHVPNTTPPAAGNADNRYDEIRAAAGDFDGDGRMEVAYGDTDGDLIIGEWTGDAMRVEATFLHDGQGGSGYVTAHDVDNDGRAEVFIGVPDSVSANADNEYGRQAWTYRMYRGLGNNDYRLAWVDFFAGRRYGMGYRNGLDGGQLDGIGGSEIAICTYPNLYVFTWDSTRQTLRPIGYTGSAASPRMLIGDYNRNGIPDIVYGITNPNRSSLFNGLMTQMYVGEFDSRPQRPNDPRVAITGRSQAEVSWDPVPGATAYAVWLHGRPDPKTPSVSIGDTVAGTSLRLDSLRPGWRYSVTVYALRDTAGSYPSNRVSFVLPNVSIPQSIEPKTITREQLRSGVSFSITYDRLAVPDEAERALIMMDYDSLRVTATLVQVLGQSILNVVFPPINADDIDIVNVGLPEVPLRADSATPQWWFPITVIDDAVPELYLRNILVESTERILLTFSEAVDPVTAADPANYVLSPFGSITAVNAAGADNVRITFDGNRTIGARGIAYFITARNVKAASGKEITKGAGNTLGFAFTADDLADVYAYPHPVRLATDERVTFANLPADAEIEVMDQRFSVIRTLNETDANGGVAWDLRSDDGQVIPAGIYFYRVKDRDDEALRKLVIKR
ncbi:MAG: hypothetical protein FGM24_03405 [Candidatus Kapabacteria bacterium]|nr:hypothetical protein [Candidatus Kapabacteria bacterium]